MIRSLSTAKNINKVVIFTMLMLKLTNADYKAIFLLVQYIREGSDNVRLWICSEEAAWLLRYTNRVQLCGEEDNVSDRLKVGKYRVL